MIEFQSGCVKKLAVQGTRGSLPVGLIASHRVPDRFQMNPDLVHSTSFKPDLQQRIIADFPGNPVVSPGGPPVLNNGLPGTVVRVTPDWRVDHSRGSFGVSVDQRRVDPCDFAITNHF